MKTSSPKTELRIYQPKLLNDAFKSWIGKMVTVRWSHPYFTEEQDNRGRPVWVIRWFGYVAELDRQIPAEELLPLLKPLDDKEASHA